MEIHNTTKSDLGVTNEIIVPAEGHITVTGEDGKRVGELAAKSPVIQSWINDGKLVAKDVIEEPTDEISYENRGGAIKAAIEGLADSDFTKDGKPEVDAINAAIDASDYDSNVKVNADERDAIWAEVEKEKASK